MNINRQVNVKGRMFSPNETKIKQNRKILRYELKIDTKIIIPMLSKKNPIKSTFMSIDFAKIPVTILIKLLAMTCEKN